MSHNGNKSGISSTEADLMNIDNDGELGRDECVKLYRYWGLGRRVVNALPRYAMSKKREITIPKAPEEAAAEFKKVSLKLNQDSVVERCILYARIFGLSGIIVISNPDDPKDFVPLNKNLTYKDTQKGILFNVTEPLNMAGTFFSQDPTSAKFMRPERFVVHNSPIADKRGTTIMNGVPLYLSFTSSTFGFSGTSVFQNMLSLVHTWVRAIISLRRMITKASSVVFKGGNSGGVFQSGILAKAASNALSQIQEMEQTGATFIEKNADVSFFNLSGVAEVDAILKAVEHEIVLALEDTPENILLDKSLVNGMAEGSRDYNMSLLAIDEFREKMMTPLYNFTDQFVMDVAWTNDFIEGLNLTDSTYAGMTPQMIREFWKKSFIYEYGNLIPEPASEKAEVEAKKLEMLNIAKALGATPQFIEDEMNELGIFLNTVDIQDPNEDPNLFNSLEEKEGGNQDEN